MAFVKYVVRLAYNMKAHITIKLKRRVSDRFAARGYNLLINGGRNEKRL